MKVSDKLDIKDFGKQLLKWGIEFPCVKVFHILGFSRIDNFIRFLNNPKYYYGVIYSAFTEKPYKISIRLFFDLVKLRLGWNDQWDELFTEAWTPIYESKMLQFTPSNSKSNYRFNGYDIKVGGKFYLYSINTIAIANDNNLCPFDLYKYCVRNFIRFNDNNRTSIDYDSRVPYLSFNHKEHLRRYQVMILLNQVGKDLPMDELQKKRFEIYCKTLNKMLMTQFEIDSNKKEREKRQQLKMDNLLFGGAVTNEELTELKRLYRQSAFLCHPDVTGMDGSMFCTITEAYNKKDVRRMRTLYNRLLSAIK
jgi:hypothetical protein